MIRERDAAIRARAIEECAAVVHEQLGERLVKYERSMASGEDLDFYRGQVVVIELLHAQIRALLATDGA